MMITHARPNTLATTAIIIVVLPLSVGFGVDVVGAFVVVVVATHGLLSSVVSLSSPQSFVLMPPFVILPSSINGIVLSIPSG